MEDLYEYMRETIADKLRLRVRAFSRRQVPECPSYPGMTMSFTHRGFWARTRAPRTTTRTSVRVRWF
jgi:hypothetical protein